MHQRLYASLYAEIARGIVATGGAAGLLVLDDRLYLLKWMLMWFSAAVFAGCAQIEVLARVTVPTGVAGATVITIAILLALRVECMTHHHRAVLGPT